MPYSITTKDGITINNIPDDVAPDSPDLKARVTAIRAGSPAAPAAPASAQAAPTQQSAPFALAANAQVTPTQQAGRDKDAVQILTQEYEKTQSRVQAGDTRAKSDLASIGRELARKGVNVSALPAPAASAPIAAPPPAPTAPAPAPAAAPAAQPQMGFFEGLAEQFTGAKRSASPEVALALSEKRTIYDMPETNQMSFGLLKAALGGLMSGSEERAKIFAANFPGLTYRKDEQGTVFMRSPTNGKEYVIEPGMTVQDIPRVGASGAAFTPALYGPRMAAGAISTIPRAIGFGAGVQTGIEASQAAMGGGTGLADLGEVALAGALGPAGQIVQRVGAPVVQAVKSGAQRVMARPAPAPVRVEPTFETQVPTAAPPVQPTAPPVAGVKQLPSDIEAAKQAGITLMTSDVVPPRTFASKWLQTIGERIPGAGTGGIRQTQQTERIEAVRNVLREFGADDAARAADDVMKDLATKRGADLTKYTGLKTEVIERLGETGTVPMTNTMQAIDDQIAKLQGLKTQEVAPIIERLTDWKAALQGQNLINVETLRKQIGESFKAPELASVRGIGEKSLSSIYKPLKQDMEAFITQVGERRDVTKYQVANKRLADLAGELDMSTLKSVLKRGDETPEVIANMLFSKKPSEVRQLYASLTPAGRASARSAILARAAEKSTADVAEGTVVSPDKFANEVKRLGTSVGVFFNGDDLKQVEGLIRVLNITKRASEAAAAPPTGVQAAIPVSAAALSSFFGGGLLGFLGTLGAAGSVGVVARIYESAPIRNLLIKIPQTVTGSKEETALLNLLTSALQTGRQSTQENQ
jgi:hypothetical protein